MSLARFTFYVLWIAPALLLAALAVVMKIRQLNRHFPAFFAYCAFSAVRTPILIFVFHRTTFYFYCYYAAEAVSAMLGLAAIYEVFLLLFPGPGSNRRVAESLFRWVGAALVLAALAAAIVAPGSSQNRLIAAGLVVDSSVRLVQFGLLFFLFIASSCLGLSRQSRVFGVALGFSLFVGVQMAAAAMHAHTGMVSQNALNLVKMASYNCAVLVWLGYFLMPEPARRPIPEPEAPQVEGWNQVLSQLLQR